MKKVMFYICVAVYSIAVFTVYTSICIVPNSVSEFCFIIVSIMLLCFYLLIGLSGKYVAHKTPFQIGFVYVLIHINNNYLTYQLENRDKTVRIRDEEQAKTSTVGKRYVPVLNEYDWSVRMIQVQNND